MARLTKAQAAAKLGEMFGPDGSAFSERTINRWMADSAMPHFKLGNRAMFDADAIVKWADRRFARNVEQSRWP